MIRSMTIALAMCLIAFVSLVFSIIMVVRYNMVKNELEKAASEESSAQEKESLLLTHEEAQRMVERASEAGEQMGREAVLKELRTALQNRNDFLPAIRRLYSDELLVDDDGIYRFAAINNELGMSPYDPMDFSPGGGLNPAYTGSEGTSSFGIDVSEDTYISSWEEVVPGKSFAIIRVGRRDPAERELLEDEAFSQNMKGAEECGLKLGAYFLSTAHDPEEAREEAEFVIEKLEPFREKISYPVMIVAGKGFATGRGDRELASGIMKAFADRIEEAGYVSMIGGNINDLVLGLDLSAVEGYRKYVIDHETRPYYPYEYAIWQYGGAERDPEGNLTPGLDMSFFSPS